MRVAELRPSVGGHLVGDEDGRSAVHSGVHEAIGDRGGAVGHSPHRERDAPTVQHDVDVVARAFGHDLDREPLKGRGEGSHRLAV